MSVQYVGHGWILCAEEERRGGGELISTRGARAARFVQQSVGQGSGLLISYTGERNAKKEEKGAECVLAQQHREKVTVQLRSCLLPCH